MVDQVKKMTDEEYCAGEGLHCPYCGSLDITGADSIEANDGIASQYVRCNSCGKHWTDAYMLIGYDEDFEDH